MQDYRVNRRDEWDKTKDSTKTIFSRTHTSSKFTNTQTRCPGFYAYIQEKDETLTAAVDHIRSIPLFYAVQNGQLFLSDDIGWIFDHFPDKKSKNANIEYELAGYVSGNKTRHPQIHQLLPGEKLVWKDGEVRLHNNFEYSYHQPKKRSTSDVQSIASTVIQRLMDYAGGRQIVIPLSGGLDSRLIAALLVKNGYENITSFTYGRPEAREVAIAQKRSEALGIDWHLVEYNHDVWRKWYQSKSRQTLYDRNANLASIPHIEMGPALSKLSNSSWISQDAVIVPGHTGDMVTGGHIPHRLYESESVEPKKVVETIIKKHYNLDRIPKDYYSELRGRISDQLNLPANMGPKVACEAFESWEVNNRQAKLIVNSMRAIEASGFDWYLPLWDRDFINFWLTVPLTQRKNQQLYTRTILEIWQRLTDENNLDAIETERSVQRSWLIDNARRIIRGSTVQSLAQQIYDTLIQGLRYYGLRTGKIDPYTEHPFGWYGIIPENVFNNIFTGNENINTFIAKERLGKISFDDYSNPDKVKV